MDSLERLENKICNWVGKYTSLYCPLEPSVIAVSLLGPGTAKSTDNDGSMLTALWDCRETEAIAALASFGAEILGCKDTLGPTILGSIETFSPVCLDELPRLCSTETFGLAMLRSAALTGLMTGLE